MRFDIPQHAIPSFLRLVEKDELAKHVWMWGQYMDSFSTPLYIETGVPLYETQSAMMQAGFTSDSDVLEAMKWRMALLTEMFEDGIHVHTGVADRLSVRMASDCYVLSYESIGRIRDWCWINQNADEQFRLDRPFDVMAALVRRFPNPHDNTTQG